MDIQERPTPEEAEAGFRALIDEGDLPQPDRVDYHAGRRELMFSWDSNDIVVVVALGADDEEEPEDLAA